MKKKIKKNKPTLNTENITVRFRNPFDKSKTFEVVEKLGQLSDTWTDVNIPGDVDPVHDTTHSVNLWMDTMVMESNNVYLAASIYPVRQNPYEPQYIQTDTEAWTELEILSIKGAKNRFRKAKVTEKGHRYPLWEEVPENVRSKAYD